VFDGNLRAAICAEVVRLLSEARQRRGWSMNQLAKQTGLSQPMISVLESSQPNPKLDSLLRMASALDLNIGDILKRAVRNAEKRASRSPAKTGADEGR
jgi:transcriptional regulator with XRE-family HTH domain